ncbi:hypothetical protein [Acetobacter thailandicus]|uniref:HTH HARE-type domain-containing protein n=1 Tax=Acetobacter thailandicus TaxID=1502842 RepID=A0ABT3QBQ7_9PROT|nr:hypothetical protein [Acetobacter thailandicus]MCX2562664.1 hypothetical protein [Acetobacter thailandicus]NHN94731.1 hypothetical protein [Acetobacter thailandicus]
MLSGLLNREATAPDILEEIKKLYRDETLGKTPVNSIRARLQEACPETGQYKGRRSLFRRVSPVKERKGVWSLRNDSLSPVASNMINDQEDILNNKILSETERQALGVPLQI